MKRFALWTFAAALAAVVLVDAAVAWERGVFRRGAAVPVTSWHAGYYDAAWGAPVPIVVPPTARFQTHYGWGIGATGVTPIYPQFQPDYPGPGYEQPGAIRPAPRWPTSTDQLGFYYIRGPW
jgi:hypothetical protein